MRGPAPGAAPSCPPGAPDTTTVAAGPNQSTDGPSPPPDSALPGPARRPTLPTLPGISREFWGVASGGGGLCRAPRPPPSSPPSGVVSVVSGVVRGFRTNQTAGCPPRG